MIADMIGVEIALPVNGDYGAALGAARLGALASGRSPEEVLTQPDIARIFTPNAELADHYRERHIRWQQLYHAVR